MKKLSFQWRLTLVMAVLVSTTCFILSFVISRFAVVQIDQIGGFVIDISPFWDSGVMLGIDLSQFLPQITEQLEVSKSAFLYQSVVVSIIVVALVSISTYFLAGKMLLPLRRVTSRMGTIEAQNLSEPLDVPIAEDEIYRMVCTFNGLLTRLDKAFATQRQFSASAAHELRTPLAVMQTKLDVLYKNENVLISDYEDVVRMFGEQTGRLSHLVSLLLEMTELQTVERSDEISLHALIGEVFCDLTEIAQEREIVLLQTESDSKIIGSDLLLYRAIYNLVENGIKYGKGCGSVTVAINPKEDTVAINVSDTGCGIDKAIWNDVFTPFFRADKSRSRKMGGGWIRSCTNKGNCGSSWGSCKGNL